MPIVVVDEDELDGLLSAYSPKFRAILQAGRAEIQQTGGIPHDDFWQQVDAAYGDAPENEQAHAAVNGTTKPKRRRKIVAAPLC